MCTAPFARSSSTDAFWQNSNTWLSMNSQHDVYPVSSLMYTPWRVP